MEPVWWQKIPLCEAPGKTGASWLDDAVGVLYVSVMSYEKGLFQQQDNMRK